MSATGHQRRRREAAADEVVDMLNGSQLAEFVKATELACEPTKDAVRAAVANQGDYTAMLEAARGISDRRNEIELPKSIDIGHRKYPSLYSDVDAAAIEAANIIDAALAEAEAVLGKPADDAPTVTTSTGEVQLDAAGHVTPAPKPKRKPAKRKPRAKKGSSK